jgi:hypothetical protein
MPISFPDIELNIFAVALASVLAMVLGAIWYGPLFGKAWMQVIGTSDMDAEAKKAMQSKAMPLYVIQFLLILMQVTLIALLTVFFDWAVSLLAMAFFYVAFIVPTLAGSAMWNNDSAKIAWMRFGIQAGYQAALFVIFALVLGMWK